MEFRKIKGIIEDIGKVTKTENIASDIFWVYNNICLEFGANKDDKFYMSKGNVEPYEEFLKSWNASMKVMSDEQSRVDRNVHFILVSAYACLKCESDDEDELREYVEEAYDETDERIVEEINKNLGVDEYEEDEEEYSEEEYNEEDNEGEQAESSEEIDEDTLAEFVNPTVNEIMSVYEELVAPCFESRPYGVLTISGVWTYDTKSKQLIEKKQPYMKRLYSAFNSLTKNRVIVGEGNRVQGSMVTTNGGLVKNYVPKFQAQIVYGLLESENGGFTRESNWSKYKVKLRAMLTKMVGKVIEMAGVENIVEVQSAIKELFTNSIIITKFDRTKELRIRYKFDTFSNTSKLGSAIDRNSKALFGVGEGVGELVADDTNAGNIRSILYVFDKKLFAGDVLFAYRAFEDKIKSGGTINEMSVLLGQKINGKNEIINMGSPQNISTVLMAGSGSGKGVLTLNILATLATSGCPFAYLDFKPDMAGALWELERETGARILAIDSLEGRTARGSEPIRKYPFGMNAPNNVGLDTTQFAIVPYLKLMQLSALLASYRASGKMPKGKKVFFILDEAQGCNAVYAKMIGNLNTFVNRNKKTAKPEELEYAAHMLEAYGEKLTNDIENVINTTGRTGLIGYFTIGQDCDPDNWKDGIHPWGKSLFGVMVGKCHTKFIGKNGGKSPTYSATGMKDGGGLSYVTGKGDEEGRLGYFVTAHGANCKDATASVFKSYLVLNDADYEKDPENGYAASLLKNIQDTTLREKIINEDFYNNGVLNERVGFKGLMRYIADNCSGVDMNEAMSSGYNLVWETMKMCGLANGYSCIEEYLFDCSRGSIFTLSELKDGVVMQSESTTMNGSEGLEEDEEEYSEEGYSEEEFEESEDEFEGEEEYSSPEEVTREWGRPQPQSAPINSRNNYTPANCYSSELNINESPYIAMGEDPSPIDMMSSLSKMSQILMDSIEKVFGDFSRVTKFKIAYDETIIINDIAIKPKLPESVIKTLPFDLRDRAQRGCYAEMMRMDSIKKFKNLRVLEIEDVSYAETRVKAELGIKPTQGWEKLFDKFEQLGEIIIGGACVRRGESEQGYKNSDNYKGYSLREKLREKFHMPSISTSSVGKMYQNKKIPTAVKVVGTIAGVGAMFWVANMLGMLALPVGLIVGHKAIKK